MLNERTILIIPDNAQNRAKYEEQVVRIFYLSHADATEVAQLLNTVLRVPGVAVIPTIAPNKTSNTITIRATAAMAAIMERVIDANDRPRAEVVLDVPILEVNRARAKQFGIDLSRVHHRRHLLAGGGADGSTTTGGGPPAAGPPAAGRRRRQRAAVQREHDLARHQRRRLLPDRPAGDRPLPRERHAHQAGGQAAAARAGGAEDHAEPRRRHPGAETTFGSLGGPGSVATQPISSFNYRPVGVNVIMTPRVTFDNDIVLELSVESSTLGADVNIAGQNLPSFGTRKVETKIRLRDGESTLLAGLLREDERRAIKGVIGLIHVPGLREPLREQRQFDRRRPTS